MRWCGEPMVVENDMTVRHLVLSSFVFPHFFAILVILFFFLSFPFFFLCALQSVVFLPALCAFSSFWLSLFCCVLPPFFVVTADDSFFFADFFL